MTLAACTAKDKGPKEVADAPARRTLLKNLGERVILASYEEFAARAEELNQRVSAWAEQPEQEATRSEAQAAFRDAMLAWERAELFQMGPAAEVSNFNPGSQGLRTEIYAWDDVRPCVVDRGLVNKTYESDDFAREVYPYGRGLAALERLLFDTSTQTACEPSDKVVTPAVWQELVEADLSARRALYAARCSEVVSARAGQLVRAFREDFLPELINAGQGSKLFDRTQEALNTLTNALFYIDYQARDLKLGSPLGHSMDCLDRPCSTELPYSKLSKAALQANLGALRDVFRGVSDEVERGDALWGLSDLLRSVQAADEADTIEGLIEAASSAVDGMADSFETAPRDEASGAAQAFGALQALADALSTGFLQKLSLSLPMRASGDND